MKHWNVKSNLAEGDVAYLG